MDSACVLADATRCACNGMSTGRAAANLHISQQALQSHPSEHISPLAQAVDEGASKAAVGCIGTELSIWNLETQQRSYLAKGAKPNRIGVLLILKVAH